MHTLLETVHLEAPSASDLLTHLLAGHRVRSLGWSLLAEANSQQPPTHFWGTCPYGVDRMYLPLTETGCSSAIATMSVDVDEQLFGLSTIPEGHA